MILTLVKVAPLPSEMPAPAKARTFLPGLAVSLKLIECTSQSVGIIYLTFCPFQQTSKWALQKQVYSLVAQSKVRVNSFEKNGPVGLATAGFFPLIPRPPKPVLPRLPVLAFLFGTLPIGLEATGTLGAAGATDLGTVAATDFVAAGAVGVMGAGGVVGTVGVIGAAGAAGAAGAVGADSRG